MKIVFLILAHNEPEQAAELATTLTDAATDAHALIHFDVRAPEPVIERLRAAIAGHDRVRMVEKRVAGRWGSFGLIEAPLNGLRQIEAEGLAPDYVMLLSGACLPCKPVAQLERFLSENAGREFIESQDKSWVRGGWRDERWKYRFWFDHKSQRRAEWLSYQIQRLTGLTRAFPAGLEPRFGSQWWTLSWPLCQAILTDIRRDRGRFNFFRSVWIPDEMVFQTYARALAPRGAIADFCLTHFHFTFNGKPIVFYNDHADYVDTLNRFFFRKASPRAEALRTRCLRRAGQPDDGAPLDTIGKHRDDYKVKMAAQTHYPRPGQCFYRDQWSDMASTVISRSTEPYVVIVGEQEKARLILDRLDPADFEIFGEVFDPDKVDLGADRASFHGLTRKDNGIRDQHPALYLMRLRARTRRVPVLTWSTSTGDALFSAITKDDNGVIIALPSRNANDAAESTEAIFRANPALATFHGLPQRNLERAAIDYTASDTAVADWMVMSRGRWDWSPDFMLAWGESVDREAARRHLRAEIDSHPMRDAAWFQSLGDALAAFYDNAPERETQRHSRALRAAAPQSATEEMA